MLGVDQQPVVTGVGELLGHGGAVGVQEKAHLGLAVAQLLLELGAGYGDVRHTYCSLDH